MSTTEVPNGIVLFHYHLSPYARRVCWYLAFRKIAYAECIQPVIMPRPDLRALGVRYRRTPTMAIGRDVYLDTRMIIRRLEEIFPPSEQHPAFSTADTAGLGALLNKLTVDASMFVHAVRIMPTNFPALKDPKFMEDRAGFFGGTWTLEDARRTRPEGLAHLRQCFEICESLFADGREWVGGTKSPTLADLEGVWSIDWVISDLFPPPEYFSETIFPKVYGWRNRFKEHLAAAKSQAPKPTVLTGADAVPAVLAAEFSDRQLGVDGDDPVKIAGGARVELFPTDGGGGYKDEGKLVKLTKDEVAIAVESEKGNVEVHIHAPRWGFRVQEISGPRL